MTEKLPVPVVWNEDCLRHDPGGEVWLGVRDAGTEVAERALVLRDALAAAGAPVVPATAHGEEIPGCIMLSDGSGDPSFFRMDEIQFAIVKSSLIKRLS